MSREIRASGLEVGDTYEEFGGDDPVTIRELDEHGDTILVTTTEGDEKSHDIDEVVELVQRSKPV